MTVLFSCTSPAERMEQYKEQAINKAWELERELVYLGHSGTHEWSEAEKQELLETNKVNGYEGHYINDYVEDNILIATDPNNIVFAKIGELSIPDKALKLARLRSYLIVYEKNKHYFLIAMLAEVIILIVAFQKRNGIIFYPTIICGMLEAIRLALVSGGYGIAIIVGLVDGFMMGTVVGFFIFLVVFSIGTT
jgi:hypothetical protein